ncbi:MAG: AsmA family protein [Deltaproteobacteria bacterium]|nr:AsmA family protein [Deltaproteobacteria bacterium]
MTAPVRPRRWSRGRKALGLVATAVIVLAVATAALLWVERPLIAGQIRTKLLPTFSAQLGRPIEVASIRVGIFPLRGELENIRIGGRPGEPPLAQVRRARANLEVWPLLVSRGHDVELRSVELDDPTLNFIHEPDGRWSLPGGAVPNPGQGGASSEFVISRLHIHGGAVHLVDRVPTGGVRIALHHVEVSARNVGSDQGSSLVLSAALGADHPNLKANLTLKPRREGWDWQGAVTLEALEIDRLHALLPAGVELPVSGGQLALTASLTTLPDGALDVRGHLDAREVSMGGRPVAASTDFVVEPLAWTLALTRLQLTGPGVALAGSASMKSPHELQFSLAGPLLDLDALLAALPPADAGPAASAEHEGPGSALDAFSATGHLAIGRVTLGNIELGEVSADAHLDRGHIVVTQASASAYGGTARVNRASADLTRAGPRWSLSAELSGVDFGRATQALSGARLFEGTLHAQLKLAGTGLQWAQLRENMTGTGSFSVRGGAWTATNLEQALAAPLMGALPGVGRGVSGAPSPSGSHVTSLHGLEGSFELTQGALLFHQPLRAQSSFGDASLTGTVGLDQSLALKGTVELQPAFVTRIVALQPVKPVTAPITIQGTLSAPKVDVNRGDVAKGLLRSTPPENLIRRGFNAIFGHKG